MKKILTTGLMSVLAISAVACSKPAVAQAYVNPINVTVGYQNSKVIDKEGVRAELSTEINGLRLGANVFASEDRGESYGVFGAAPINIKNTNFNIVPRMGVERYREVDETVGLLGVGAEYQFTPTVRADATYTYSKGFDNSDISGDSYLVGLTKSF